MRVLFISLVLCASIGAQQAADPPNVLLMKLQADPDDIHARSQLMDSYLEAGDRAAYMEQVLWLINNRPESPAALPLTRKLQAHEYEQAQAAWETQLRNHPDSPPVLSNAARFVWDRDPLRSVALLEQARNIAAQRGMKNNYVAMEANLYAEAIALDTTGKPLFPIPSEQADAMKVQLSASSDPELLSESGKVMQTMPHPDTRKLGRQFMEKAVTLAPENQQLQATLDKVKNPPAMPVVDGAVRISGAVAESNLLTKVEPVYPLLAHSARVSGTVEFVATISKDGTVTNLQLVRGHPLLVVAAREAVLQYKYRPTLLNGSPVDVVANIIVPFKLDPQ